MYISGPMDGWTVPDPKLCFTVLSSYLCDIPPPMKHWFLYMFDSKILGPVGRLMENEEGEVCTTKNRGLWAVVVDRAEVL